MIDEIYTTEQPNELDFIGYDCYLGKTVQWVPTDSEENFAENVKHTKNWKCIQRNKWSKYSIDYKFNSKGFRCPEFEKEPNSIVWLGCSHTIGIGLPEHMTFASIVCSHFNLKNFNLGIGGGANDTCFRVGHYWIPIIQPRYIVYVEPDPCRIEFKGTKPAQGYGYCQINAHSKLDKPDFQSAWDSFIRNESNMFLQREKNFLALKQIAMQNNAKFLNYDSFYFQAYSLENPKRYKYDRARDCMHAGPNRHRDFANIVIADIAKLNQNH